MHRYFTGRTVHLYSPQLFQVCLCAFTSLLGRGHEPTVWGGNMSQALGRSFRKGNLLMPSGKMKKIRMESVSYGIKGRTTKGIEWHLYLPGLQKLLAAVTSGYPGVKTQKDQGVAGVRIRMFRRRNTDQRVWTPERMRMLALRAGCIE